REEPQGLLDRPRPLAAADPLSGGGHRADVRDPGGHRDLQVDQDRRAAGRSGLLPYPFGSGSGSPGDDSSRRLGDRGEIHVPARLLGLARPPGSGRGPGRRLAWRFGRLFGELLAAAGPAGVGRAGGPAAGVINGALLAESLMSKVSAQPTRISTKGQLLIPKQIRERHGWAPGTEILIEDRGSSVILRRAEDLPPTTLADLVGCAEYGGAARTLEDMEAGIARGARSVGKSSKRKKDVKGIKDDKDNQR